MCLAIPGKIVEITGDNAVVDYGGVRKKASLMVMPNAKIGDIVLVHAGFAIAKVKPDEAKEKIEAISYLSKAVREEKERISKEQS